MDVAIERADPKHAADIYNVHMASIRGLCARDYTNEQIEAWTSAPKPESYVEAMANGEAMFIALKETAIVGFAGVREDEICAVYVHPDHIGGGVGARLLKQAENQVSANGFTGARLRSTLTARGFYLSHGWEMQEESTHELRNGMRIPCVVMAKRL